MTTYRTLQDVKQLLNERYDALGTWRKVGAEFGINHGLLLMIAREGHRPERADIRSKLGMAPLKVVEAKQRPPRTTGLTLTYNEVNIRADCKCGAFGVAIDTTPTKAKKKLVERGWKLGPGPCKCPDCNHG